MTNWELSRFAYIPNKGTFGILTIPGIGEFNTIEQDWENNKPNHSCIPCGVYNLSLYLSPARNSEVILLDNPELLSLGDANGSPRTYIEIHPANWMRNVKGCIGPGESLGDSWNVTKSVYTMDILLDVFKGSGECSLKVYNRDGSDNGYPK